MSDNSYQPTSVTFMQSCNTLGIHRGFTSYNNPKGNADTERVIRTLKEEPIWLQEWNCSFTLIRPLERWIVQYNEHYFHSALGYKLSR
jgi:putative transposase